MNALFLTNASAPTAKGTHLQANGGSVTSKSVRTTQIVCNNVDMNSCTGINTIVFSGGGAGIQIYTAENTVDRGGSSRSVCIGDQSTVTYVPAQTRGVAIGYNATVTGNGTGISGDAVGENGVAVSGNALADNSTAIGGGYISATNNTYAICIGAYAQTSTDAAKSITMGYEAYMYEGAYSIAIGSNAEVRADNVVALGYDATVNASGDQSVCIGSGGSSTGLQAVCVGAGSSVTADHGVAVGPYTSVTDDRGVALGRLAEATGQQGVAIGDGSSAAHTQSIALGALCESTQANEFAVNVSGTTTESFSTTFAATAAVPAPADAYWTITLGGTAYRVHLTAV